MNVIVIIFFIVFSAYPVMLNEVKHLYTEDLSLTLKMTYGLLFKY